MRWLILDPEDRAQIGGWAAAMGFARVLVGGILSYSRKSDVTLDSESRAWLQKKGFIRLFEDTYLPSAVTALEQRNLVQVLFRALGTADYEAIIDVATNHGCYEFLYQTAIEAGFRSRARLLDFGSGPGTILSTSLPLAFDEIWGYDFCESNQALAAERGLRMLDSDNSHTRFELALSAYVFHYGSVQATDMDFIHRALEVGGFWLGNFHKSLGLDQFLHQLESHVAFKIQELRPSPYGPVIVLRTVA